MGPFFNPSVYACFCCILSVKSNPRTNSLLPPDLLLFCNAPHTRIRFERILECT